MASPEAAISGCEAASAASHENGASPSANPTSESALSPVGESAGGYASS